MGGGSLALQDAPGVISGFEIRRGGDTNVVVLLNRAGLPLGAWDGATGRRLTSNPPNSVATVPWRTNAGRGQVDEFTFSFSNKVLVHYGDASFDLGAAPDSLVGLSAIVGGGVAVLTCDPNGVIAAGPPASEGDRRGGGGQISVAEAATNIWPPPPPPRAGMRLVRTFTMNFDYNNKTTLTPNAQATTAQAAKAALGVPGSAVIVAGHTDGDQSREYAISISEREANAVRDGLVQYGVSAESIGTIGYGKERPLLRDASPNLLDRRAEIFVYAPPSPSGAADKSPASATYRQAQIEGQKLINSISPNDDASLTDVFDAIRAAMANGDIAAIRQERRNWETRVQAERENTATEQPTALSALPPARWNEKTVQLVTVVKYVRVGTSLTGEFRRNGSIWIEKFPDLTAPRPWRAAYGTGTITLRSDPAAIVIDLNARTILYDDGSGQRLLDTVTSIETNIASGR